AGAAPAAAEPPSRLAGQVTDTAGVLSPADERAVEQALERLQQDAQVQLWVVYVGSFDGAGAQRWAEDAAIASDLGVDDVLLAVAVQDRAYSYSVDEGFRVDEAGMEQVGRDTEDRLAQDAWADAAVAGADSLRSELAGAGSGSGSGSGAGLGAGSGAALVV
ncbi:TPM domain-containing protein, partial [Kineococcus sp. T13]|uniref:TPM domain-containing protein n=1 Tax=Kineococcus vitellinus TaxID=2696565 RepID=UPI0014122613